MEHRDTSDLHTHNVNCGCRSPGAVRRSHSGFCGDQSRARCTVTHATTWTFPSRVTAKNYKNGASPYSTPTRRPHVPSLVCCVLFQIVCATRVTQFIFYVDPAAHPSLMGFPPQLADVEQWPSCGRGLQPATAPPSITMASCCRIIQENKHKSPSPPHGSARLVLSRLCLNPPLCRFTDDRQGG